MTRLRLLLADDHALVREGLRLLVSTQPDMEVVGEAENGLSALVMARDLLPDLIIMDVSMPEMGGAEATRALKLECPSIKILALSRHSDRSTLRGMLEAGVSGYVHKRATSEELLYAIRRVIEGGLFLDPRVAVGVIDSYVQRGSQLSQSSHALTEREAEVLRLIAWGYSNKEIGGKLNISVKTVESHRAHIMEKLELRSRTDLVRYALRQGWLQEG